jgi:hypothetical protein
MRSLLTITWQPVEATVAHRGEGMRSFVPCFADKRITTNGPSPQGS